jgi:hypothetical protein
MSQVIVTAPTFDRHIKDRFWPELRKWRRRASGPMGEMLRRQFDIESHHIRARGDSDEIGREWFAVGTSSDDPGKMEGFHAHNILFLADEAKTIPRGMFEAITGSLTDARGEQKMVLISTPPETPVGYFYDCFAKWPHRWRTFHISAFDAAKLGAVAYSWIEEKRDELGEGTPAWQAQVLGEFPDAGEGTLIPLSWIEAAKRRHPLYRGNRGGHDILYPSGPVEVGVDVAQGGADQTVYAIRMGSCLWQLKPIIHNTAMQGVGAFIDILRTWNRRATAGSDKPAFVVGPVVNVKVEKDGPGKDFGDLMPDSIDGIWPVKNSWFRAGGKPLTDRERFANQRAEGWWALRSRFQEGSIAIPDDNMLSAELASITYDHTPAGKVKIVSKDNLRAELGRSPDRADACMIAFAYTTTTTGRTELLPI